MHICNRAFFYAMALIVGVALQENQVYAQTDLNIQSRIDAVAAPFQVQPIPIVPSTQTSRAPAIRERATVVETEPACVAKGRRCLSNTEIDDVFAKRASGPGLLNATPGSTDAQTALKDDAVSIDRKRRIIRTLALPINIKPAQRKVRALPVGPPNLKPGLDDAPTQPTAISFTFPGGPTYESNANRSNKAGRSDGSASFGGGFTVTTQGFRNLDVIGITAGTNSVRYARLSGNSFDTVTTSGQYQAFLGAYGISSAPLDLTHGSLLPAGQVTFNTLTFGIQNSTAFAPIFQNETTSLTTPTMVYSWQNIPFAQSLCATKLHKDVSAFCYYADVNVTLGHTYANIPALENTNLAVSATLGDRIGDTDFIATWGTTINGRAYDHVVGGRNDVLVTFGPKLQYKPIDRVTTSIGVTYNRNYSSLATAEWRGWIVQSGLTLSF